MKKAAREEKRRQPKQSKDEMPPPASLQGSYLYLIVTSCILAFLRSMFLLHLTDWLCPMFPKNLFFWYHSSFSEERASHG